MTKIHIKIVICQIIFLVEIVGKLSNLGYKTNILSNKDNLKKYKIHYEYQLIIIDKILNEDND